MDNPVMIAIPVYRSAELIRRTLESALAQTHRPLHVVVMDNASDDNTLAVVAQTAAKHPHGDLLTVVSHDAQVGRIGNWNRCLDHFASTEDQYLKFLFAGDLLHHECVATLVAAAESANSVMVSSAYEIHDDGIRQRMSHCAGGGVFSPTDALVRSVEAGNWFGAPSVFLVAGWALGDLRFSKDFSWGGDWKFCLDLCLRGRTAWVDRSLTTLDLEARRHFRAEAGTLSSRLEDAWLKCYAIDRLRSLGYGTDRCDELARELERSVKGTLLDRRDLIDVTAAKIRNRLKAVLS